MNCARRRLDVAMVSRGLARSRGHARELLDTGRVSVGGSVVRKPAMPVTQEEPLSVREAGPVWVSRAAYKLVGALDAFGPHGLDPGGRRCLDAGAGTGGFTQVLLQHGAAHVIALDVGRGQLAEPLRSDARVEDRSSTTIRGLTAADLGGPVDLLVADLSFISLTLVLGTFAGLLRPSGDAVVLVKPQFEVGRQRLGKNGIVRSAGERAWAVTEVVRVALEQGLEPLGLAASPIRGAGGNAEYFLWLAPGADGGMGWDALMRKADQLSVPGAS